MATNLVLDKLDEIIDSAAQTFIVVQGKSYRLNDPAAPLKAVAAHVRTQLAEVLNGESENE